MNTSELQKQRISKFEKSLPLYNNMISKIAMRISESDRLGANDFLCEVPYVIIGEPSYNQSKANTIICNHFLNGRYYVQKINDSWIYINWSHLPTNVKATPEPLKKSKRKQSYQSNLI